MVLPAPTALGTDESSSVKLAADCDTAAPACNLLAPRAIRHHLPAEAHLFERVEPSYREEGEYLAISRRSVHAGKTVAGFNRGLKAIRETGDFERIVTRHMRRTVEGPVHSE